MTEHRAQPPDTIRCFVLTISDTRTSDTDTSGDAIETSLRDRGCTIAGRTIVPDEPSLVRQILTEQAPTVDVVVTTGGTGISARDSTYEAIAGLLDKRLDGFGELFRMLSHREIGSAAMMSRACAGTIGRTAVFSLPGSLNAVRLGLSELILPEITHVVRELRR